MDRHCANTLSKSLIDAPGLFTYDLLPVSPALPPFPPVTFRSEITPDQPSATARVPLTVVIPTLDEERRIADAIASLAWADDVIVIDGGSRDRTALLAEHAGARVLVVRGETIAGQRNAGIAAARHEWVLALDADERVSDELRAERGGGFLAAC